MKRWSLLLNTGFSGPQAWLLLAIRRGHVAAAGVQLDLIPGTGAYNAAPGMAAGGQDLGYGDLFSLVEVAAHAPRAAPLGIFASFNASPSAILVAKDGPIRTPPDLVGRRLIGHASDVALRTFPSFAAATGLDASRVAIAPMQGGMAELAAQVTSGEADGLFAYVSTVTAALAAKGQRLEHAFHALRYNALVPDLHGSGLMASRRLLREHPETLRRLVAALNQGLAEALADPDAAISAVCHFAPGADPAVERRRWDATLAVEMAHPIARAQGFGDVDAPRFARAVALHARTLGLPRIPDPSEIFSDAFLPPRADRARPN